MQATPSQAGTDCYFEREDFPGGYSMYSVCVTTTQMYDQPEDYEMEVTYTLLGTYYYT